MSEWANLVAALRRAYPNLDDLVPYDTSRWSDDAYWDDPRGAGPEEGQTRAEVQADHAVSLYDLMVEAELTIPEPLRVYIPHAKQVVEAWKAHEDACVGSDEQVEADKERAKLERRSRPGRRSEGQPERRPWQGRQPVPQAAAEPVKKKLERFWLHNKVFEVALTPYAFRVYCYLARRAGKSGVCWPSVDTIVKECQMDPKTVTRALKMLRQAKMIAVKRGSFGRSSKYRLTDPSLWVVTTPFDGAVTEPSRDTVGA